MLINVESPLLWFKSLSQVHCFLLLTSNCHILMTTEGLFIDLSFFSFFFYTNTTNPPPSVLCGQSIILTTTSVAVCFNRIKHPSHQVHWVHTGTIFNKCSLKITRGPGDKNNSVLYHFLPETSSVYSSQNKKKENTWKMLQKTILVFSVRTQRSYVNVLMFKIKRK